MTVTYDDAIGALAACADEFRGYLRGEVIKPLVVLREAYGVLRVLGLEPPTSEEAEATLGDQWIGAAFRLCGLYYDVRAQGRFMARDIRVVAQEAIDTLDRLAMLLARRASGVPS